MPRPALAEPARAEGGDGEALAGRVLCSGRGAPTPRALREAFPSAVPSLRPSLPVGRPFPSAVPDPPLAPLPAGTDAYTLESQFLHKSLLLLLHETEQGLAVAAVLNRPTAS